MDGGSEYQASFEQACQQPGVHLFVLSPHSPKLPGIVEQVYRIHPEEFYAIIPKSAQLEQLNIELYKQERIYTQVRPHQALDYLTPT